MSAAYCRGLRRVRLHRHRVAAAVALVAVASVLAVPSHAEVSTSLPTNCSALDGDAIHDRVFTELAGWVRWLHRYHVRGMLGEFGWPDARDGDATQWNCLAGEYYDALASDKVSALVWDANAFAGGADKLAIYGAPGPSAPAVVPDTQSMVFSSVPTSASLRGIAVSGSELGFSEYGSSTCDNMHPGVYGVDYVYPSAETFQNLANHGFTFIRIPVRWERLQPNLYRPLDPTELGRLQTAVDAARAAGLGVIIDIHDFGQYIADVDGTQQRMRVGLELPISGFVDLWRRISVAFRGVPGVSYELMNEPKGAPGPVVWERASQAALAAIRANHDAHWIYVDGFEWAAVQRWWTMTPRPWIRDRLNRVVYVAHHYWDLDWSARYQMTYAQENAQLAAQGW